MRCRILVFGIALAAAVTIAPHAFPEGGVRKATRAEEETAKAPVTEEAPFTGKILVVQVGKSGKGMALKNARFKQLGGRAFLVGEFANRTGGEDWPQMTYWFPTEELQMMIEFNSLQDAEKAYDTWKEKK
jgi:hypothetical protein